MFGAGAEAYELEVALGAEFGFVVALREGPAVLRGVRGGSVGAVEAGGCRGEGVGGAAEEDYAVFFGRGLDGRDCWDGGEERRGGRGYQVVEGMLATTLTQIAGVFLNRENLNNWMCFEKILIPD